MSISRSSSIVPVLPVADAHKVATDSTSLKGGKDGKEAKVASVQQLVAEEEQKKETWPALVQKYLAWLEEAYKTCKSPQEFEKSFYHFLLAGVAVVHQSMMLRIRLTHLNDMQLCGDKVGIRTREVCRDMLINGGDPAHPAKGNTALKRAKLFNELCLVYKVERTPETSKAPAKKGPR